MAIKADQKYTKEEILELLPQHHLFRARRVRDPGRFEGLLQWSQRRDADRGRRRGARRRHQGPVEPRPREQSPGRAGPLALRHRRHGRDGQPPPAKAAAAKSEGVSAAEEEPSRTATARSRPRSSPSSNPRSPAGCRGRTTRPSQRPQGWRLQDLHDHRPAHPCRRCARRRLPPTPSTPKGSANRAPDRRRASSPSIRRPAESRAYYGGDDCGQAGDDMAGRRNTHPPGSSMKPYVLAAAVDQGISIKSRWDPKSPREFDGPRQGQAAAERVQPEVQPVHPHPDDGASLNTIFWALSRHGRADKVEGDRGEGRYLTSSAATRSSRLGHVTGDDQRPRRTSTAPSASVSTRSR